MVLIPIDSKGIYKYTREVDFHCVIFCHYLMCVSSSFFRLLCKQ
jgi:hypothetical protein